MAIGIREFELVTEVSSPGLYFFASDLKNRGVDKNLPDNGWATDHIFGERPKWEITIPELFQMYHPTLVRAEYEYFPLFQTSIRVFSKWLNQNGPLHLGSEYYSFFRGQRGMDGYDQPIFRINGTSGLAPRSSDGSLTYLDRTAEDPNGHLGIELVGSKGYQLDERGPYWRGRLELKGNKLGELITDAVDLINQNIKHEYIPTWKVI